MDNNSELTTKDALIESIIEINYGDGTDFSNCDSGCDQGCGCQD